jgi:sugar/nucleoside kinase (ribokinase family)
MTVSNDSPLSPLASRPHSVLSFGDLVTDVITYIPHLPAEGGMHQVAERVTVEPGGAGNFLIAGARLGLHMSAMGVVGDDLFGRVMLEMLEAEGIETGGVHVQANGSTTTVTVLVDRSGQHVFLGQYGVGPVVPLLPGWRERLLQAGALMTFGYTLHEPRLTGALLEGMALAHAQGVPVFFDPGPFGAQAAPEVRTAALTACSVLLLTEEEVPALCGGLQGAEGVRVLLGRGPRMVCVKRGAHGCAIFTAQESAEHPGYRVPLRDTSAAGDSFAAAFIYATLNGWPLARSAAFANAMGAAKVQKEGTGRQVPTREEVMAIFGKGQEGKEATRQ